MVHKGFWLFLTSKQCLAGLALTARNKCTEPWPIGRAAYRPATPDGEEPEQFQRD